MISTKSVGQTTPGNVPILIPTFHRTLTVTRWTRGMINAYHTVYTMDIWNDKCLPRWSLGTTKIWVQIVILVCKLHICHSLLAIVFYINCFHLFLIMLTIFKTCLRRNYLFSNLIYLSFMDIKICSASYERDIPKSSSVFSASCVAYACAFRNSSTAQRRRKLTAANSLPRTYKKKVFTSQCQHGTKYIWYAF